ncbi:MAG: hypothetical protein GY880_07475 [Planctomycetaceae bacterium]|nr:hypothetical protein [Planctomycetaceae bacterium]
MTETTVSPVVRKMISASRWIISDGLQRWPHHWVRGLGGSAGTRLPLFHVRWKKRRLRTNSMVARGIEAGSNPVNEVLAVKNWSRNPAVYRTCWFLVV